MKTWCFLLLHEARNARSSLVAAALMQFLVLALLHEWKGKPEEVAAASAIAISMMTILWTLHLAADSFAADLSSGRLATRALLPVSSRALWTSKIAFLVLSIVLLAGCAVGFAIALQLWLGDATSLGEFLFALPALDESIAVLVLVSALGVACSLLVESALTALLLACLALGLIWGLRLALEDGLYLIGARWNRGQWAWVGTLCAMAVFAIGLWSFTCSQRRLGSARVRVRTMLCGTILLVGGLAGSAAAAGWHYAAFGLKDPRVDILVTVASPDGRFLVLESAFSLSGDTRTQHPSTVWALDLERGTTRLIAWPGEVSRDYWKYGRPNWSAELGLQVLAREPLDLFEERGVMRLDVQDGQLRTTSLAQLEPAPTPHMPDWAQCSSGQSAHPSGPLTRVRWKGTGLERAFHNPESSPRIGHDLWLSPIPGRVLVRRDDRLAMNDFSQTEERPLLDSLVAYVEAAPDASALLVRTKTHTHLLWTSDGSALHAPWPLEECLPQWIQGDESSHELLLSRRRLADPQRILDFDSGREFELKGDSGRFVARVAERGYVHTDEHGDLVWVDREGRLVRVLVDRD